MNALIVYASLTGNTFECAEIIARTLKNNDVDVTVKESLFSDPIEFLNYDIAIVGSYTYGIGEEGELPDEIIDFYDDLSEIDLSNKIFGVFGSGDDYYKDFCLAVDMFEQQFLNSNAQKGCTSVKVNLFPEEKDFELLQKMAISLIETSCKIWKIDNVIIE